MILRGVQYVWSGHLQHFAQEKPAFLIHVNRHIAPASHRLAVLVEDVDGAVAHDLNESERQGVEIVGATAFPHPPW